MDVLDLPAYLPQRQGHIHVGLGLEEADVSELIVILSKAKDPWSPSPYHKRKHGCFTSFSMTVAGVLTDKFAIYPSARSEV